MNIRGLIAFVLLWIAAPKCDFAQDAPTFRSGTRLVQINVLVRDKNGPVSQLKRDDFILTDKGKPQQISVFSVSEPGAAPSAPALPAGTFSNRMNGAANPGSITVVLLDRLNTLSTAGMTAWESSPAWLEDHALGFAKQQLLTFVKQLDPKDRVAIYSLGESLTVLSDFTGERDQLIKMLTGYRATSLTTRESADPGQTHTPVPGDFNQHVDQERQLMASFTNINRAQVTLTALASIAAHLTSIPGRKSLVWLTADLPFPAQAAAGVMGRANVAVYPMDARGLVSKALFNRPDEATGIMGLSPHSADAPQRPRGQDTMEEIAADTGGRAFINTNDLSDAIRSAVQDSAATYTLGFYPDSNALDGKFHELKVRSKQGHFEMRYPKGYLAVADDAAQIQNSLRDATQSPLDTGALRVEAHLERVNSSISIAGSVDVRDVELIAAGDLEKGEVQVFIIQQDAAGRVLLREKKTISLALTKDEHAKLLNTGIAFRDVIEPKEGAATIRIIAADAANGATGSLIVPVSQLQ